MYVRDGFLFESNYESGLQIFDTTDPLKPKRVGFFDTYPESNNMGFNGMWGVFPFFPSGTVIASNEGRGLFIFDVSQATGGGGEIPCEDVRKFVARCRNSKVKVKVKFTDKSHDGGSVAVTLDGGDEISMPIKRKKAKLKDCCHEGAVSVALVSPGECKDPIEADCG